MHGVSQNQIGASQVQRNQEMEENLLDKFCLAHPQKKTKYFCEND